MSKQLTSLVLVVSLFAIAVPTYAQTTTSGSSTSASTLRTGLIDPATGYTYAGTPVEGNATIHTAKKVAKAKKKATKAKAKVSKTVKKAKTVAKAKKKGKSTGTASSTPPTN
jgi:hypothetical protein